MGNSTNGFAQNIINSVITPGKLTILVGWLIAMALVLGGSLTRISLNQEQFQKDLIVLNKFVSDLTTAQNKNLLEDAGNALEIKKNQEFANLIQRQNEQTHRDILVALRGLNGE